MLSQSLSSRLKLLTLLWLAAAVASILLTLRFSWRLEGGAAAINDAGSLRMQTYRIGLAVNNRMPPEDIDAKIRHFDHTLATLRQGDPTRPLFLPDTPPIPAHMDALQAYWQGEMKPMFVQAAAKGQAGDESKIPYFIGLIDELIRAVENVNTRYLKWLWFFQIGLLAMVLLSAAVTVLLLYRWIINPLITLQNGVRAIHDGRLGEQVPAADSTEFAQVNTGFNRMSMRLQELYTGLEQRVAEQTRDLADKNYILENLYAFSHFLNQTQTAAEAADGFLQKIIKLVPAQAGSIRLIDFQRQRLDLISHTGLPEHLQNADACRRLDDCLCGRSVRQDDWQPIIFGKPQQPENNRCGSDDDSVCHRSGFNHLRIFKIRYNEQDLGMMTLYFSEHSPPAPDDGLLEALCSQLGVALTNIRLVGESRQLAVLQERNLMAQGLHDSIAQSLTFLNLQVQMLESAMAAGESEQVNENLNFIKEGVQECYDDVRELLLNFRTKITRREFNDAVRTLVQRFEQQTHIAVHVRWHGDGPPLSSEQQLQLIFILQESLSNIRKHAQAQHVTIDLDNRRDFVMRIADDGRGFEPSRLQEGSGSHVGLGIMRERAQRINAVWVLESAPDTGTCVRITLPHTERILE
ncbi:MAG: type IV pili methyl-accepting chemotaxis transducer N-terminal domain-containing protein [Conchiformibius sp.]|nr:type IV pili methyl-accepting chemotaxis transducer N-terminal domain-containing protein [Conchiformibius sp.]